MYNSGFKFQVSTLFIVVWVHLFLISCNSEKRDKKITDEMENDEFLIETLDIENQFEKYKIPTPMDFFVFMEQNGVGFFNKSLNDPDNQIKYLSQKSKALNLGIYSADLAYCCVFNDYQSTLLYFDAAKKIASELGLNEGFGQEMALRIDNNLSNIDSLTEIATDSYFKVNIFLEEQGLSDMLGLMMVGAWIESLYLAIESVHYQSLDDPVIERIADQQVLLENLIAYLSTINSGSIQAVYEDLEELQEIFDQLYFNNENTIITKEQFVSIANKVRELRNSYIK